MTKFDTAWCREVLLCIAAASRRIRVGFVFSVANIHLSTGRWPLGYWGCSRRHSLFGLVRYDERGGTAPREDRIWHAGSDAVSI